MKSSSASLPSNNPNLLENRIDFKLHAASRHLENLKQLELEHESLTSNNIRIDAEIELDEFFYHLVGVMDALLHEINREFNLGIKQKEVKIDRITTELQLKKGAVIAKIMTQDIRNMQSIKQKLKRKQRQHPLWLISEFNNHSKHRAMIGKAIVAHEGVGVTKISLINPQTRRKMKKPIIDYLDESYKRIERVQKKVRKKIAKYI